MTQIRPRIDGDLAADVRAYAKEWNISFSAAVTILLRSGLQSAAWPQPREKRAGQEQDAGSTT